MSDDGEDTHGSDAILLGTSKKLSTLSDLNSINISGTIVSLSEHVKLLSITLDWCLTSDFYITSLSKSCFYHIRALRHIRPILSEGTANLIASSLVSSRLDYANACLFGISAKNIAQLQRIQNTLTRVVTRSKPRTSTAPMLKHLHWLPVSYRIQYKTALLTYKSLHLTAPPYLSSLIQSYNPTWTLHSSNAHKLITPFARTCFGSRGFRVAGPTIWNTLPCTVKTCTSIYSFKKQLKLHLFASALS